MGASGSHRALTNPPSILNIARTRYTLHPLSYSSFIRLFGYNYPLYLPLFLSISHTPSSCLNFLMRKCFQRGQREIQRLRAISHGLMGRGGRWNHCANTSWGKFTKSIFKRTICSHFSYWILLIFILPTVSMCHSKAFNNFYFKYFIMK